MVRTLLIIAAASFVLMLVSLSGAAAIGGPELMRGGWTLDLNDWDDDSRQTVEWSGPVVERALDWSGTDTLTIAVPADVTFTQGEEASVVIRGPEGAVQRVTLVDGHLSLPAGDGGDNQITIFGRGQGMTVEITAPDVSRFVLEGHGNLTLNNMDREALDIRVEGAGDIEATGTAASLNLVIDGAGEADLADLTTQTADVRIEGAGDAEINASQSANVVIDGVGNVDLVQRPARLTQDISGVGSVRVGSEE
ncbi:MAG: DUF2807 domain-containing protein [Caulobacterales bacterium]|nr:DUF2807 domain-containing protein [Caulobacterales bacterium]